MRTTKTAKRSKTARSKKSVNEKKTIDPSEYKRKFLKKAGANLREGYKSSSFRSYKELVRECVKMGHKFSPELIVRYFSGDIEPGIYAFTGMVRALEMSADRTLLSGNSINRDEMLQKHLKGLSSRIKSAMVAANIKTPAQVAIIAQNLGFSVSQNSVEKIIDGEIDPLGYEIIAIASVLQTTTDKLLWNKSVKADANVILRDTADNLVNLLQSSGHGDKNQQELNHLFDKASPALQEAVLALLRSAANSK